MARIVFLVDMDAFFTACEVKRNLSLKGKAIAVGADPKHGSGRGVVATASYEARKFGLHSAMPISTAYKKCPSCIFLPVDYDWYAEVSEKVMNIIRTHASLFQQVSIDEAYLELDTTWDEAKLIARTIKREILAKEKITCSIGIGQNKLIAKMAASKNKPNGLTIIRPSGIQKFLDPLDVDAIPGVGPKMTAVLKQIEINTIKELSETPLSKLSEYFGAGYAQFLHDASRGIDESPVSEEHEPKSVSRQVTFEYDIRNKAILEQAIHKMIDDAILQIKKMGFRSYKLVTLRVRYEDFETHDKSYTLIAAATDAEAGKNVAKTLLNEFARSKKNIRLIGVTLGKLA